MNLLPLVAVVWVSLKLHVKLECRKNWPQQSRNFHRVSELHRRNKRPQKILKALLKALKVKKCYQSMSTSMRRQRRIRNWAIAKSIKISPSSRKCKRRSKAVEKRLEWLPATWCSNTLSTNTKLTNQTRTDVQVHTHKKSTEGYHPSRIPIWSVNGQSTVVISTIRWVAEWATMRI